MKIKTYKGIEWTQIGPCRLACGDSLSIMPLLPDLFADVVITDPPYGIEADKKHYKAAKDGKMYGKACAPKKNYGYSDWDNAPPPPEAFEQMHRLSKHQVIWGGNYFTHLLPPSPSWIVWDKDNGTNRYADFELAWTSHRRAARKFRWRWFGMLQEAAPDKNPLNGKELRIHPTQKPVKLLEWVLNEYTGPDDLILDPYLGSGTTLVACIRTGRRGVGIEADRRYFDVACRRLGRELEIVSNSLIPLLRKGIRRKSTS